MYSPDKYFISKDLQHRLDLFSHLLEFSQQILVVHGPEGAGRRTFCQHVMHEAEPEWRAVTLDVMSDTTPDYLIKKLANGVIDDNDGSNETISLLNNILEHCSLTSKVPILIIENAQELNAETLKFVFSIPDFSKESVYIRIVLLGDDQFSESLSKLATDSSRDNIIHALNIPSLSAEDTKAFLQLQFPPGRDGAANFTDKEINRIYKVSAGLPRDIIFLGQQGLNDPAGKKDLPASPTKHKVSRQLFVILGASLLLTILIGVAWVMVSSPESEEAKTIPLRLPESSAMELHAGQTSTSINEPLPEPWLEQERAPSIISAESEPEEENLSVPETRVEAPEVDLQSTELAKPAPPVESAPVPPVQEPTREVNEGDENDNHWILVQADKAYVLQLIGAKEKETVIKYSRGLGLKTSDMALIRTSKNGEYWYILTYGLFPDIETARQSISALPASAKVNQPWPNSIKAIKSAIKTSVQSN